MCKHVRCTLLCPNYGNSAALMKYAMVGLDSNSEGCSTTEQGDKNELDYGQVDVALLYGI